MDSDGHNATTTESNMYSGMKMSWTLVAHTHMDMQLKEVGGRGKDMTRGRAEQLRALIEKRT